MQKKIIALAIAAAAAAPAFAQVTVYGLADAYWASTKVTDHDRRYSIDSAGLSGSRIGFKAVEDLGIGTSALAVIEYGFAMDDGKWVVDSLTGNSTSDSGLAARQKLVGLTGGWGTAVLGYAQTAGYDFACGATPFAGSALDPIRNVSAGTLLSCGSNGRANNAFAYISPNFGGVTLAWNHARVTEGALKGGLVADLVTGEVTQDKTTLANGQSDLSANLLAATYSGGPVTVNAVYSKITDSDNVSGSEGIKEFGLRGSYNLGVASLFASYQSNDIVAADNKDTTLTFGAAIPVGPAGTVAVDYGRSTLKETAGTDRNKKDAFAVAYLHSLSKRTTAYAGYTRINNKTGVSDVKTDILAVGLRHSF